MKVMKYKCPKCGYSKVPATHKTCDGILVRIADKWVCNACGKEPANYIICAKCNHSFYGNWVEEDMPI